MFNYDNEDYINKTMLLVCNNCGKEYRYDIFDKQLFLDKSSNKLFMYEKTGDTERRHREDHYCKYCNKPNVTLKHKK